MKPLFIILFTLLISTCFGQTKTHYNEIGGYEISYDKSWTLTVSEDRITLHAPLENRRDNEHENLGVSRSPIYGLTLEEAYNRYIIEPFPNTFKDFLIIDEGDQEINGIDSKWIKFSFFDEEVGINATNHIQLLINDEFLYILIGYASSMKFLEYEESFNGIIQTIRFR